MTMIFQVGGKRYCGSSAVAVVRAMESDARDYPHAGQSIRQFVKWSLGRLRHRIPPREMNLSGRLDEETAALNYLCLRDEYDAGNLYINRDEGSG